MTNPDPFASDREAQHWLDKIGRARHAIEGAESNLTECVRHAKTAGASWTRVGQALGTTRSAAQKRYRHITQPDEKEQS